MNPDDEGVRLRSLSAPRKALFDASLLIDGEQHTIPEGGLELPPAGHRSPGRIVRTTVGDQLLVAPAATRVMVNGERIPPGGRVLLDRGASIAFGDQIAHYLAAGAELPQLDRIERVAAGRISVNRDEFVVGRAKKADLRLDHPTVMLRHAVIRAKDGHAEIHAEGHGSTLHVNGFPVRHSELEDGDEIAIGPFRIVFGGAELFKRPTSPGLRVEAAGVSVTYGDTTILHPTNLALRSGELTAIIGESGAGKSTLMNLLAGVRSPTQGTVTAGGEPVARRVSEIGYVPQFDIVHDNLKLREALDFAAQLRLPADTSATERAERINEVMVELALADRAEVMVGNLSGGQRKRVAVGIELLHRPGALFLDEPTTGLDPGLERHLMRLLRSIADRGQTVTLVTHATSSIQLCDRVVVMGSGGRMRFNGTPSDLLDSFGVDNFDEVYDDHSDASVAKPRRRRLSFDDAEQITPDPELAPRKNRAQQNFAHQTQVLSARYVKLMGRDRRHLRNALLQAPILAVLTALLFPLDVFETNPTIFAGKSAQLLFLMAMIAAWLGSVGAAREIVKERSVIAREFAVGVRMSSYLASKMIVLAALTSVQVFMFTTIVLILRPLHEAPVVGAALMAIFLTTGFVAILLGLLVSANAKSEDQATGVIPLLLVPQLLLSGAIVAVADMTPVMAVLSALVPTRWSFAAAGNVIGIEGRIAADKEFSAASHYGTHFFDVSFPLFLAISLVFSVALLGLIAWRLRGSRKA